MPTDFFFFSADTLYDHKQKWIERSERYWILITWLHHLTNNEQNMMLKLFRTQDNNSSAQLNLLYVCVFINI